MRAVISNVFSDSNKGGAILTKAAIEFVKSLDDDVSVGLLLIAPDEDATKSLRHTLVDEPNAMVLQPPLASTVARFGGLGAFLASLIHLARGNRSASQSRTLKALAEADVVVSKGGHVFVQREGLGGLLSLWVTAFPLLYAWRCGNRTVAFGATVGPFQTRGSRWVSGFVLRRLTAVVPRERLSTENARALGVLNRRLITAPDGAFALTLNLPDSHPLLAMYGLDRKRFAVLTTGYPAGDEDAFVDEVATCMTSLAKDGLIDDVVVVLHVVERDGSSSDRLLSQSLVERLAPIRAVLVDHDHSPEELIALYREAVFVSGRRLHSTLFGILARVPSIPIVHPKEAQKAQGLFDDLNLGYWVVDSRNPGELFRVVHELLEDDEIVEAGLESVVVANRTEWSRVAGVLREIVANPQRSHDHRG